MIALDCTFRDGGYYNDWSFGIALANRYLKAMKSSKIDAIEIGFRSPPQKNGGVFINVTDEFIEKSLGPIDFEYFVIMAMESCGPRPSVINSFECIVYHVVIHTA